MRTTAALSRADSAKLTAPRARRALALCIAVGTVLGLVPAFEHPAFAQDSQPETAPIDPAIFAAIADIRSPAASDAVRQQAADLLVLHSTVPEVRQLLSESLKGPLATPGPGASILKAIARRPDASPRLYPLVVDRLGSAKPEELPRILEAMGSFRTRQSAQVILKYAQAPADAATADAAFAALARLAARDDIGPDAAAWSAWFKEVSAWSEGQWRMRLLDNLSTRVDHLAARNKDLTSRLIDSYRRLHLAMKPEDRQPLLASLLLDEEPGVKALGFELVARELAASGRLNGPVGDAAVQLLRHPQAATRAAAAVLVRQLAPAGAGRAVAEALARETDARAAQDLLLAAVRWPTHGVVEPTLRWMESDDARVSTAAIEAAWWLYRAGELGDADGERALAVLRARDAAELTPAACSLLAALGNDDDRAALSLLLNSANPTVRQAVAEALLWYPEYTDEIYRAAAADPDLFDVTARTMLVHEPTADGFRSLLHLPMPAPEISRAALLRLARALPATDLLDVIGETADAGLRRSLLALLVSEERSLSERSDPDMREAIFEGALQLADVYLDQNQAEDAFVALESAPEPHDQAAASRAASLRCTALLAIGRVELAEDLTAPASAWLRGLRLSQNKPFAKKILDAMQSRFRDALSPDEEKALATIQAEIAAATTAAGKSETPDRP